MIKQTKRLMVLAGLAAGFVVQAQAQDPNWYNSSWGYRKEIIIAHTNVTATLTNFPVLVSLTNAADMEGLKDKANAGHVCQSDGGDILFVNSSGTKLNHEIEKYTATNGQLIAWVKVNSLSSNENTAVYMYYGNSACSDQWNMTNTWDTNFVMVQHLQETSGTNRYDSTSYGNNGTASGGVTYDATGKINGADDFNGAGGYIRCGNKSSLNMTNVVTIEAWVKWKGSQVVTWAGVVGKRPAYILGITTDRRAWFSLNGLYDHEIYKSGVADNDWSYIAGVYNGTQLQVYVDGAKSCVATDQTSINISGTGLAIGNVGEGYGYYLNGVVDEARVSDIVRSDAWLETSYKNQGSPSTFYSVGAEQIGCKGTVIMFF